MPKNPHYQQILIIALTSHFLLTKTRKRSVAEAESQLKRKKKKISGR